MNKAQLRVFSAICANLVVLWLGAFLIANDYLAIIRNVLFSAVFWYLAVKAEEMIESYDKL